MPMSLANCRTILSKQKLADMLLRLEEGVHIMHCLGVSHGDIKLENVLLTMDYEPVLIDFGSSTFHDCQVDSLEAYTNVAPGDYGTAAYLPPEMFLSLDYDRKKADFWALGVLAYVLFTGTMPWGLASLRDARWRNHLGVEVAGDDSCMAPESKPVLPLCSSSMAHMVHELPVNIQEAVAAWLSNDPTFCSYSQ
ncbi:kinase-like protein [Aureobasidium subglaciale]|nr:kinase-like protein [Aureobasidium subglaciale]KAI5273197.1 kinase-like protein [Aureobasidium subglaciale]